METQVISSSSAIIKESTQSPTLNLKDSNKVNSSDKIDQNVIVAHTEAQKSGTYSESSSEDKKSILTTEELKKVAQQLQDFVSEMNKGLEFSVHEDSGRDVIKVIDKNSGDLVKQYPSEEVLDIVSKLAEATGSLVDYKV